jgi:hypothetical protein
MSDTSRTDDQISRYYDDATGRRIEYVPARFARQLERELAEMEEQCESWANQSMSWKLKADVLQRKLEELKEWQTLAMWGGTPQHVHEFIKGQQTRIRAAQDAEEQRDRLAEAARAVVARWETPLWKEARHTGKFIRALADALDWLNVKSEDTAREREEIER